jgi:uncharacterized membrane protein YhaH (DUF805 family)
VPAAARRRACGADFQRDLAMSSYLNAMRNYLTLSGRASRMEYWMFALIAFAIMILAFIVDSFLGIYVLPGVFQTSTSADINGTVLASAQHDGIGILTLASYLVHVVPGFTVAIRRVHDVNKSAWTLLLGLIPLVGLYILYLMIKQGTQGPNSYGPSPRQLLDPVGGAIRV